MTAAAILLAAAFTRPMERVSTVDPAQAPVSVRSRTMAVSSAKMILTVFVFSM